MHEPISINRKLPPHELNARRARKRAVTCLPAVAQLTHRLSNKTALSNHKAYNPAANPTNDPQAKC